MYDTDLSAVKLAIEQRLAGSNMPALAVGITDRHQMRCAILHGCSDLRGRAPLTAGSRFAIGSISKSFTAVALMQLMMEGRFDPHAPVTHYLPSLAGCLPFKDVTAHHLLTHTSGLPSYLAHASSSRYVLAELRNFEPSYAPGAHFWYSNTGYQLLGYVLEGLERLPYETIIRRRILSRLDMRSTSAVMDHAQRTRTVTSYTRWPYDGQYLESPWLEYSSGDGSVISTVPDLCAYARLILSRGVGQDERLLSEEAFTRLTAPALESYAYGFFVQGEGEKTIIRHGGAIGGFHSSLAVHMEDGFGLVLLSSSLMDAELKEWIGQVVTAGFRGASLPAQPIHGASRKVDVQDYAGVYHSGRSPEEEHKTLEFTAIDGQLCLKQGNYVLPLQRMGRDCFRVMDIDSDGLPFFFHRADSEANALFAEVSHGTRWYVTEGFTNQALFTAPDDYSAYVGHYAYDGPEGPSMRIFVRNSRLWAMDLTAMYMSEQSRPTPLEPIESALFRFGEEAYSPERVRFDTVLDGVALRMLLSGIPLYRKATA